MLLGPIWPPRWIAGYPDRGEVAENVLPHMPGQTLLATSCVPDPANTVTVPVFMIVTSFSVAVELTEPSAPNVVVLVFSGFQIRL